MAKMSNLSPARVLVLIGLLFLLQPNSHAHASPDMPESGPSFPCIGRLNDTERAICTDSVLSAHDRAMAWAYSHRWLPVESNGRGQTNWLAQRNNCAGQKSCILSAYHSWISALDSARAPAANFLREGPGHSGQPDSKPLSAGLTATSNNRAELFVVPMGSDWFMFSVLATHIHDPNDGRGPNVSTGEATGLVRLSRGTEIWVSDPVSQEGCTVSLTRLLPDRWQIKENGACSGTGTTLNGTYRKIAD